ncbi:MAG: FtsX-like permease family protein [Clostridia bacterium]|nr:FtsX-like permease family protein [Clostridia bacterium]
MSKQGNIRSAIVSFAAALEMLRGRRARVLLMMLQFTIGFCALAVLAVLIVKSSAVVRAMELTFNPTNVLGLGNYITDSARRTSTEAIVPDEIPALEAVPGVRRAAVFWDGLAFMSTGADGPERPIKIYLVNDAFESLVRLRVTKRFSPDVPERVTGSSEAGDAWAFLTNVALAELAGPGGVIPDTVVFRLAPDEYVRSVRLAGTVADPTAGWPECSARLDEFAQGVPALVMDFGQVAMWAGPAAFPDFSNSVWLVLEDRADADTVGEAVNQWYSDTHPDTGHYIGILSIKDAIAECALIKQPPVIAAAGLSALLLILTGLGFAGHTMYTASARRSEWALRMAVGATRGHLVAQVIIETFLVILVSAAIGTALVAGFVPMITRGGGWWQSTRWVGSTAVAVVAALAVLCALAAAYPVHRVSREEPSSILKEDL